jgi:hypothetical protein
MLTTFDLDPRLDAVIAAPTFHDVLLENDHVRVLEVTIDIGAREPFHTHVWQSVFIPLSSPAMHYFVPEIGEPSFSMPRRSEAAVLHLAHEGLHALENIDSLPLYAFRVELKRAPNREPPRGSPGPILESGLGGTQLLLDNDIAKVCWASRVGALDAVEHALLISPQRGSSRVLWLDDARTVLQSSPQDIVVVPKYF